MDAAFLCLESRLGNFLGNLPDTKRPPYSQKLRHNEGNTPSIEISVRKVCSR